jgi:hypothetical protein
MNNKLLNLFFCKRLFFLIMLSNFTNFENSQSRVFSTYKINPIKLESCSLVPYGSNLSSNVGIPKFNKLTSSQIYFPPHIKGVVVGLILSDAWISFSKEIKMQD